MGKLQVNQGEAEYGPEKLEDKTRCEAENFSEYCGGEPETDIITEDPGLGSGFGQNFPLNRPVFIDQQLIDGIPVSMVAVLMQKTADA